MTDKYAQDVLRRDWSKKMPKLRFPPEWEVCIQPPWALVDVRFVVWEGPHRVSVLFEIDDIPGNSNITGWKVWPMADNEEERLWPDDAEGLMDAIRRSLDAQKAGCAAWREDTP